MKKAIFVFVFSLIIPLAFLACTADKQPSAPKQVITPTEPELTLEKTTKADWETEWDKILMEARREGRAIIYTSRGGESRQALMEGFKKRTGLDLEFIPGSSSALIAKVLQERRVGLYLADAFLSGPSSHVTILKPTGALRPMMPDLFLPEVLDVNLWYKGRLPFVDEKDKMTLQTRLSAAERLDAVLNPELVNREELISWHDLLKPKFKGKMNMYDPQASKGFNFIREAISYYGLDWDYMRALAKQEPMVTRDERMQIEWVAKGRHLLALNPDSNLSRLFLEAGAPLASHNFKESVIIIGSGGGTISLMKDPAHPNAIKLFINWFLSKEGQGIYQRSEGQQSAREDIPVDYLPKNELREPGKDYVQHNEKFYLMAQKDHLPKVSEIFGPLVQ